MASLTRWAWVWVSSGRLWWTGRPGALRFMGSQRVGHDWATELNWTAHSLGWVQLCVPWTVVHQAPLSMGFSRQEYWSGLLFPAPRDLPGSFTQGLNLHLLHWQAVLYHWAIQEVPLFGHCWVITLTFSSWLILPHWGYISPSIPILQTMNETEAFRSHVTHPRSQWMEWQHEEAKSHCLSLSPVVFTCDCASESPRGLFQGDTDLSHSQSLLLSRSEIRLEIFILPSSPGKACCWTEGHTQRSAEHYCIWENQSPHSPTFCSLNQVQSTHTRRRFSCLFVSSSLRKRWFFSLHHCLRANGNTRCQRPPVQSWVVSN